MLALEQIAREGDAGGRRSLHRGRAPLTSNRGWWQPAGEVGYKLHTGRSRNEQIATDLRLYVREQIDGLSAAACGVGGRAAAAGGAAGNCAMPAYTHLQRAEPVLVAHWLLAYAEMFLRDQGRLADCRGA